MHITQTLFGIDGAVAAVVGQSTIGSATAQLFEEAGAQGELIPIGDGGLDLGDEQAVAERLEKFVADHGRLDILVYAAIEVGSYPLTDTSLAQGDRLHGTNLRGAFLVLREGVEDVGEHLARGEVAEREHERLGGPRQVADHAQAAGRGSYGYRHGSAVMV